jgi:hypothetical protein
MGCSHRAHGAAARHDNDTAAVAAIGFTRVRRWGSRCSSSSRLEGGDHDSVKRHESVAVFSAELFCFIEVVAGTSESGCRAPVLQAEDHDGFARGSRHGESRKREYAGFVAARAVIQQPGGLALSGGMVVATEWGIGGCIGGGELGRKSGRLDRLTLDAGPASSEIASRSGTLAVVCVCVCCCCWFALRGWCTLSAPRSCSNPLVPTSLFTAHRSA